jgi:hypothetical protein
MGMRGFLQEPGESDEECKSKCKGKAIPVQAYIGTLGSRRLRLPGYSHSRHMKVAMLSAPSTGRLPPPPPKKERFLILISVTG